MRNVSIVLILAVFLSIPGSAKPEITEFIVKDLEGDLMVLQVNSSRQECVVALVGMIRTGERKWIGGEIEIFGNEFGFRFVPDTVVVSDVTAEGLQAVKFRSIQLNFSYWKGLGTVYISGEVMDILLSKEDARFKAETNRDFLIFWAVLFFSCVVAIIELLPQICRQSFAVQKLSARIVMRVLRNKNTYLSIIYFGLLFGIALSIYSGFKTYGESAELTFSGEIGEGYKHYVILHPSLYDIYVMPYAEACKWVLIIGALVVFGLLYCVKIGIL